MNKAFVNEFTKISIDKKEVLKGLTGAVLGAAILGPIARYAGGEKGGKENKNLRTVAGALIGAGLGSSLAAHHTDYVNRRELEKIVRIFE